MKILPISFNILTICGFWRPVHFKSSFAKLMYNSFSLLMCFFIYTFTASHMIEVIKSANNFEEFTGNCFMLLSMLNVCCKMTNILYFRKNILDLITVLMTENCVAGDSNEEQIQEHFHARARFVTVCYFALTETTCMLITLRTFFASAKAVLPFKAWIPYALSSQYRYWLTFIHQTVAHVGAANLQIANETLICGLMIQACSQLELLKYRLIKVPGNIERVDAHQETGNSREKNDNSKVLFVKCMEHHRRIIEFSEKLNKTFNTIIFVQFVISSLVLCSSVYLLSKMNLMSVQFMSLSLYLSCMLYQIFLFCWYGNEVILQSIDVGNAVYNMDWSNLSLENKKKLITAMLLIRKPIKFTSSFFVTLSIDSYCKILKTSYSVFNLLQRTSV